MKSLILTAALVFLPAVHADFSNESEAGIVLTGGNSDTQSWHAQDTSQYAFDKNSLRFNGNYLAAKQNDLESAQKWSLGLRFERELAEKVSSFVAQSAEGDKFAGVLQRYNSDIGAKFFLAKREKDFTWDVEAGYRFTHEHTTNALLKDYQKGRIYSEAEKYWAATTSTKLWVEYLPNFTFARGWLFNAEASVSSALNSVFSVKTAYLLNYNNSPASPLARKTDTSFTTSLVAKF